MRQSTAIPCSTCNSFGDEQMKRSERRLALRPGETFAHPQFAHSVAIAGNVVVVGALNEDSGATGVNGTWIVRARHCRGRISLVSRHRYPSNAPDGHTSKVESRANRRDLACCSASHYNCSARIGGLSWTIRSRSVCPQRWVALSGGHPAAWDDGRRTSSAWRLRRFFREHRQPTLNAPKGWSTSSAHCRQESRTWRSGIVNMFSRR